MSVSLETTKHCKNDWGDHDHTKILQKDLTDTDNENCHEQQKIS